MVAIADGIRVSTTTVGTGVITVDGVVSRHRSLSVLGAAPVADIPYVLWGMSGACATQFERGRGTLNVDGTFTRDTVENNSDGTTTQVTLLAGTKHLFVGLTASALLDVIASTMRVGVKQHATDTFTASFLDEVDQRRIAEGDVTVTLADMSDGANMVITVDNPLGDAIAVTAVDAVEWLGDAPLEVPAGQRGIISLASQGILATSVVGMWAVKAA